MVKIISVLTAFALAVSAKSIDVASDAAQCQADVKDLAFTKEGILQPNSIWLNLSQAGQAQQTNSRFAKSLRKVAGGFELPLSAVGDYLTEKVPNTLTINTSVYKVNFQYNFQNNYPTIVDVKCHYGTSNL